MVDRIGEQLGNYRLLHLIGRGGFADVYLGEHIHLKTQAAIKVLHARLADENIENFRNEAQTIAHLIHPHIIRVLDFDVDYNVPFLVMDYAPNGSLRQRHPKGTQLTPNIFLPYVEQIADALQYAHNQRLIHRDVKPENMLIGQKGDILLSDFGVAVVAESSRSQQTEDVVIGTMGYMAPEQIQGKSRPASDQYSLAIVVYEWITGARPFNGSYMEVISQHLSASPPPMQTQVVIPPAVEQVIFKALSKDPHQRFGNMLEFSNALAQAYQRPTMVFHPSTYTPSSGGARATRVIVPEQELAAPAQGNAAPTVRPATALPTRENLTAIKKGAGRVVKRGLVVIMIAVILGGLLLCGLGYLAVQHFTGQNSSNSSSGTVAAVAVATNFLSALSQERYPQAYNTFDPTLKGQVSQNDFMQEARTYDRCDGPITQYTKDSNTTIQGATEKYSYTISRGKLTNTYHLLLTLQKDSSGTWHISNYDSSLNVPNC